MDIVLSDPLFIGTREPYWINKGTLPSSDLNLSNNKEDTVDYLSSLVLEETPKGTLLKKPHLKIIYIQLEKQRVNGYFPHQSKSQL